MLTVSTQQVRGVNLHDMQKQLPTGRIPWSQQASAGCKDLLMTKCMCATVPTVERTPEEPPPFVVLVQGPPQVRLPIL